MAGAQQEDTSGGLHSIQLCGQIEVYRSRTVSTINKLNFYSIVLRECVLKIVEDRVIHINVIKVATFILDVFMTVSITNDSPSLSYPQQIWLNIFLLVL